GHVAAEGQSRTVVEATSETVAPSGGGTEAVAGGGIAESEQLLGLRIAILILLVEREPVFVRERRVQAHADIVVVVRRRGDVAIVLHPAGVAGLREIFQQSGRRGVESLERDHV